jgi:hypothetical protein
MQPSYGNIPCCYHGSHGPYRIFCVARGGCHSSNQTGSSNSWTCSSLVNEIRAGTRAQRSTVRRQISRVRAEATRSTLDLGSLGGPSFVAVVQSPDLR